MPEIAAYRKIAEETIGRPLKISQMCGGTDARMFADRSVIVMHSVNGENSSRRRRIRRNRIGKKTA